MPERPRVKWGEMVKTVQKRVGIGIAVRTADLIPMRDHVSDFGLLAACL